LRHYSNPAASADCNAHKIRQIKRADSPPLYGDNPALTTTTARAAREDVMLILTRRIGETLKIGDNVTVAVLGVKGNQVRVGIDAPKSVPVHREEIFERIKREGQRPA